MAHQRRPPPEEQILEKLQSDDPSIKRGGFIELWDRYSRDIFIFIRSLLRGLHLNDVRENILQDVYLVALEYRWKDFKVSEGEKPKLLNWLYSVAHKRINQFLRDCDRETKSYPLDVRTKSSDRENCDNRLFCAETLDRIKTMCYGDSENFERDVEIVLRKVVEGEDLSSLAEEFHLAESSIEKIIQRFRERARRVCSFEEYAQSDDCRYVSVKDYELHDTILF